MFLIDNGEDKDKLSDVPNHNAHVSQK